MKPITDRFRISREKLSYLFDSTATPVATLFIISTWIGYEVGLFGDYLNKLGISENPYLLFLKGIPYQFYSIFCISFIITLTIFLRDFGPMFKAERRARREGKIIADGDFPLMVSDFEKDILPSQKKGNLSLAIVPISFIILGTIAGLLLVDYSTIVRNEGEIDISTIPIYHVIGNANSFRVLLVVTILGNIITSLIAILSKSLDLKGISESWVKVVTSHMPGMIILVLAWSISNICNDLNRAGYLSSALKGSIPIPLFPMLVFIVSGVIGFSTGTSWGSMAILIPIVIQLSYSFSASSCFSQPMGFHLFLTSIMSVLSGAVFGDHKSPISYTTILSSMAYSSDHIAHMNTRILYGIAVALVAIVMGFIPSGLGIEWYLSLPAGIILIIIIVRILGKSTTTSHIVSGILKEFNEAKPREKGRFIQYLSEIQDRRFPIECPSRYPRKGK